MTIRERLEADLKQALKQGDRTRVGCIRMLKSKLQEREVALRGEHGADRRITEDEATAVVRGYAKQRRDSIESYRRGGREDLVAQEQAELEVVLGYLPPPPSADELRRLVREAITESGATSARDLGRVMKLVMPKTGGAADGKEVQRIARELLEPPPG